MANEWECPICQETTTSDEEGPLYCGCCAADNGRDVQMRRAAQPAPSPWRPIAEAPREPVAEGWGRGPLIYVKPTWGGWDIGWWDLEERCFRMIGDDGPHDEQPTHWMPLPPPPSEEVK